MIAGDQIGGIYVDVSNNNLPELIKDILEIFTDSIVDEFPEEETDVPLSLNSAERGATYAEMMREI